MTRIPTLRLAACLAAATATVLIGASMSASAAEAPAAQAPAAQATTVVAPYVDLGLLSSGGSLAGLSTQSGIKTFTLAFATGAGCTAFFPASRESVKAQIDGLRAIGGDVIMSFGGASGAELAQSCTDQAQLEKAYADVGSFFGVTAFDMDIEGAAAADPASIDRRSKALAAVQKQNPDLTVSLTLPVLPTGLTDGLNVVKSAQANGLKLSYVNVMAMDYGAADKGDRGDEAIAAAKATLAQIRPVLRDTAGLSSIGVTPMLGENDDHAIYNQDDAKQLAAFATQNGLGYLGFWEVNRDKNACTGALFSCTNVPQTPLEFSKIFATAAS
jgi:hypothetical protein